MNPESVELTPIAKLRRDIKASAKLVNRAQARFLVDLYYTLQDHRKALREQERSLSKSEEPCDVIAWFGDQAEGLEKQAASTLDAYSQASELGRWARGIDGVGPVIAAGLLCHVDIEKASTVGKVWRFAGLDPTVTWKKGEKRPWNASLKSLCWKLGESFVKVSGNEDAFYGRLYAERKKFEWKRNLDGGNAEAAKRAITEKNYSDDTGAKLWYSGQVDHEWAAEIIAAEGTFGPSPKKGAGIPMLPPAHIHSRAKRYAVKMFLSHYVERGRTFAGLPVPEPYAIAILGHADRVPAP